MKLTICCLCLLLVAAVTLGNTIRNAADPALGPPSRADESFGSELIFNRKFKRQAPGGQGGPGGPSCGGLPPGQSGHHGHSGHNGGGGGGGGGGGAGRGCG